MSGNQNGGEAAARGLDDFDFKTFLLSISPITRTLVVSTIVCTIGSGFGLLPSSMFGLVWPKIIGSFHFWRPVTSFFHLGGLGFPFLINTYFLYHYSTQLENGFFLNRTANYCWFLFLVVCATLVASFVVPIYAACPALLMAIMHVWGRHSPTLTVKLYGFIAIPAKYLSLAMLALDLVLTGGFDTTAVVGLVAGHAYYFFDSVYPTMPSGKVIISTPQGFADLVDQACVALAGATGIGQQAQAPAPQRTQQQYSGTGNVAGISGLGARGQGGASTGARPGITVPNLRTGYQWGSGRTLGSQ